MPAERFFTEHPLKKDGKLSLQEDEAYHLIRVMRARVNDQIEVINGRGQLAKATISSIDKQNVELILDEISEQPIPPQDIILCVALPRFVRLEFIIEKGTELGVSAFWLFQGERSEKEGLSEQQSKRLRHLSIAAIKQCGRLDLPEVILKPPLKDWSKPTGLLLFGDTDPKAPLLTPVKEKPVLFFSGPESGFSSKETALLTQWHAKGVSLHRNILRADTAPIAATVILGL